MNMVDVQKTLVIAAIVWIQKHLNVQESKS